MATNLPEAGAEDVLYILDLSGYIFRAYHAIAASLSSPTGEPTHATLGTVTMIQLMITQRRPVHLLVAMDSRSRSFRKDLYAGYKATRQAPPEDMSQQMARCREIVEAYRFQIVQKEGIEADDLIAAGVRIARSNGMRVVIVSSDKDLMQLVGDGVVQWDSMRNKVYGPPEVEEKLGVPPSQVRDFLALTGDTSDNIPGVPSVGPKTATDLLKEHGTLEHLYENLDKVARKKLKETLQANEENARLSQRLVTLKDDIDIELTRDSARIVTPDVEKLRTLFTDLGFTRLLGNLGAPATAQGSAKSATVPSGQGAGAGQMSFDLAGGPPATAIAHAPPPAPRIETRRHHTISTEAELTAFVADASKANWLSFHAESDGRDPARAQLVGLSLSIDPEVGHYIPLTHRSLLDPPTQLSLETVKRILGPLLAGDTPVKTGHQVKDDELLLVRHGLSLGKVGFDAMIADYLLDSEAAHDLPTMSRRYLEQTMTTFDEVTEKSRGKQLDFHDVAVDKATAFGGSRAALALELTQCLGAKMEAEGVAKLLDTVELPLARTLVEMERHGVLVDIAHLGEIGKMVDGELAKLETKVREIAGKELNIASPRQLETLLFDELGLRVVKRTKTGRSTDAEVLEALSDDHPLPGLILEHRVLAKLKGTYIDSLPQLVNPVTGRIHTHYGQTVAATGRLSSTDPNLQNIPIRTEVGKAIRGAFIAPPGFSLVSADYSQIELRVLADLSKDPVLVEAFTRGQDIHTRTAMEVFGKTEDAVTEDERRASKTINFGVIYGMGDTALGKRLGIPRASAAKFIRAYFERYAGVRTYFDEVLAQARSSQSVSTMLGRRRFLPDLSSANRGIRLQAERIAQNTPIQGSAADILKLAMIALAKPVVPGSRMILTVHDELVFEVPDGLVAEAEAKIKTAMEGVVKLGVPLLVEAGHGRTWADAH